MTCRCSGSCDGIHVLLSGDPMNASAGRLLPISYFRCCYCVTLKTVLDSWHVNVPVIGTDMLPCLLYGRVLLGLLLISCHTCHRCSLTALMLGAAVELLSAWYQCKLDAIPATNIILRCPWPTCCHDFHHCHSAPQDRLGAMPATTATLLPISGLLQCLLPLPLCCPCPTCCHACHHCHSASHTHPDLMLLVLLSYLS